MPKTINKHQKYSVKKKNTAKNKVLGITGNDGIKSASELGIKADSLGITKRKAKTHKGRKILESKEAKLIEDPKRSIMIKGNKTS